MKRYSRKKNSTKIFIVATTVAAVIFGASAYFFKRGNDVVVAQINDQKVYKSEIERKLRSVFDGQNLEQNQETKIPEVENLPKEVIEILVKEVYLDKELAREAKKSKISDNKEVKDKIADAKDKILRQAYIDSLVKQEITDQKVSDKYAELSNELTGKKEYSISHIVTKTKDDAEKVLKEMQSKKPAKFSDLAKKYSIDQESAEKGGDLGYILEDNMIKEIGDTVESLKKDEVSNPIQTKFGWHIIKISDVRDAKALPFESVKDNIREQLAQDKLNEINSRITKNSKVKILIKLKEAEAPKPETEKKAEEKKPEEVKPDPVDLEKSGAISDASKDENVKKADAVAEEKVEVTPADEKQKTNR
ncbi:MAG: peptidylprolyl isomerase [Pseudomonadota bacterium]